MQIKRKMRKKRPKTLAKRVTFPEEKSQPWLTMLLDAYFIADKGIALEIAKRLKAGDTLACKKGCSSCCTTHITIPVYPLEVVGIYWYVIEKILGPEREIIKKNLMNFEKGAGCPFLVHGACSIHPVRPLACRHFNVFNRPCSPGEDPYYTRRKDVLSPNERFKERALAAMLPFHGIKESSEKKRLAKAGALNAVVKNLHEIDWKSLARRMDGQILPKRRIPRD